MHFVRSVGIGFVSVACVMNVGVGEASVQFSTELDRVTLFDSFLHCAS
jgi:hypothetical protein